MREQNQAAVQVDPLLYAFYRKVALAAGKTPEEVMGDVLKKFAFEAAESICRARP